MARTHLRAPRFSTMPLECLLKASRFISTPAPGRLIVDDVFEFEVIGYEDGKLLLELLKDYRPMTASKES